MKYSTVEIVPDAFNSGWRVKYDDTDHHDRESRKEYLPNAGLGFFHYPRKWGVEKGFLILKNEMIRVRQEKINSIMQDIEEIKNLQLPDWVKP